MRKITATIFATALLLGQASASDELDITRTIRQFIDSFNKGDAKSALDVCASQTALIDEFPPYVWQGATGCADWLKDFNTFANKNVITEPKLILGRTRVDVAEGRAYTVTTARFFFRQNGKRQSEQGIFVTTLQNAANGWRITGWAWAKQ